MTEQIEKRIVEIIIKFPKLLLYIVASFFSGQFWLFLYFSYLKKSKRANNIINNKSGKVGIGAFYFFIIMQPIHYIKYHQFFNFDNFLSLIYVSITFGILLQALAIIFIPLFMERRS